VGDPETTVDAAAAEIAKYEAEQKSRRALNDGECRRSDGKVVPIKLDLTQGARVRGIVSYPGKPKSEAEPQRKKAKEPLDEALVNEILGEVQQTEGAGSIKEEPKGKAEDEEAVKSDLGPEEVKRRQTIRRLKLEAINRRCAVIRSFGGKCVVVTKGQSRYNPDKKVFIFQSKEAFEQWMANEFIPSLLKKDKNDAVGPWWWRHKNRRQYDGVVFKPRAGEVVETSDGQSLMNMYLGWGVMPKPGDWSLIRRHITEVLAGGDPKAEDYIIRWIAWAIQHPDCTADVALVLIGEKGTGKGTLARALEKIFGHHSFQASSLEHVVGRFNAHKENCILFVADEAYWGGHKSATGELQRMITEPVLPIERKGFDIYEAPNYIHMLMLAEPGWVVPAGRFERRYAAFKVSEHRMDDFEYFKALRSQIDKGGAAAMLHDLQQMDLGDWHPREVYRTAALRQQQELSLLPFDEWMLGLLEDGALPGTQPGRPRDATPANLLQDAKAKVPRLRDIGKMKLSEYLREQWQLTTHGGVTRGYNFPSLKEMRKIWDKRFGQREWPPQADLGQEVKTPLADLLKQTFSDGPLSETDRTKLLEMSDALKRKRPNETSSEANSRILTSILMRDAAEGDDIALKQLLDGMDVRDFFDGLAKQS
jgi:hypothetical protein